jgi:tetratricopeptide (TPR) repeat protein
MILRLSTSAERAAILAAAILFAAVLSFYSLRNALAQHYAGLQSVYGFQRATKIEPGDARNWYLLGRYWQYNLEDPDGRRAIDAYHASLAIDPHDADTWLDLATAEELEGDIPASRSAYLNAKKSYPLSPEVAWRFGNFLLRQGDLDSAFSEMRRAVDADPKRGAEALSRSLRVQPDVNKVLDSVIPHSPKIYLDIIFGLASEGQATDALKVWNRLVSLHPSFSMADAMPLVDSLRRKSLIPEATSVWLQAASLAGLTNLSSPPGSVLWDGSFESGVQGGAYAWLIPTTTKDVDLRIDTQEKHSGNHSLRITFDGRANLEFLGPCSYAPVQPSTAYLFSAWVHTREMTADQGLRFRLMSLGGAENSVVIMDDFRGDLPWTRIETLWTSAADVHEVQICLIRKPSGERNNRVRGRAWIDDVALTPQPPESSKP